MKNKRALSIGVGALAVLSLGGLVAPLGVANASEPASVVQAGQSVNELSPPKWTHGVDLMLRNETKTTFDVYYTIDETYDNWKLGATLEPGQSFTHGDCHSGALHPDVMFKVVVNGKTKWWIMGSNPSLGSPYIRLMGKSEYGNRNLHVDCDLSVGEWSDQYDYNLDKPSEKTILETCHRDSDNKDGWKQMQCYLKHIPSRDID